MDDNPPQMCRWTWKDAQDGRLKTVTFDVSNKQVTWEGKSVMTFVSGVVVLWCGGMWCGVMWCGVMWCDVVGCGVV